MTNRYAAALGRISAQVRKATLPPATRRKIADRARAARIGGALPEWLRPLFHDHDFDALRLPRDKSVVMLAVLSRGSAAHLKWLTVRYGREELRRWIRVGGGRGLTRDQLLPWFGAGAPWST